jgi:hypothetical protein
MLKSKLDFVGIKLPKEVYTINFIALLDTQYPVWANRQRSNTRSVSPTLPNLIADILDEARKAEKATVLYSGRPDPKKGAKGGKGSGNKETDKKCDYCNKQGHLADTC